MREYINKKVRLSADIDGKVLYYSGEVISVTDTHITFIDKFGDTKTKRIADIIEIEELRE